jgi:hypothetical protein
MGFDIRTAQRENLPVFAAAEGYVSRISIEEGGFGRAIYITHPNGFTTVYAHLNDFYPALQQHITEQQYAKESWQQRLTFTPDQFPVTKGQFIAYSGNTGASAGPHLHFEIRDSQTENNLNPWLFNFGIPDNIRPDIYRLYYYDRRYSTYQISATPVPLKGSNGNYSINGVLVLATPTVSFAIAAEDKNSASPFRYGIYSANIYWDDTLKCAFKLDDISYNETRYLNASIDYKTKLSGGSYIQHLSRLPGNKSSVFEDTVNTGLINITDTLLHNARIVVKDAAGNSSILNYKVRFDPSKMQERYFSQNYLNMQSGVANNLKEEEAEVTFSAKAFYDVVPFEYSSQPFTDFRVVSKIHNLHNYKVPVHDFYTARIKADRPLAQDLKERVVMQLISNRRIVTTKGRWINEWMEANFRELGSLRLLIDTVPPTITAGWRNGANLSKAKAAAVFVKDNLGSIKNFTAYADGQWLLFVPKGNNFVHKFDGRLGSGSHELKVIVEDIAGNITERSYSFIL